MSVWGILVVALTPLYSSLSVNPELEMAALQARAALVTRNRFTHSSRYAAGIHQFIKESTVPGLLPTVVDHSACSSMSGPKCWLLQSGEVRDSGGEDSPLLDGVRFADQVLNQWDTMLSIP
jgi:hypothetical protein